MPSFADRILLIHEALARAQIGHGFGGAIALAYYVEEPRATRDIDLNISIPTNESRAVLRVLPVGIAIPRSATKTVGADGQIRLWWDGPSGIPVDLFFPQHEFHEHVARDTRPVPFMDTTIPIISATHLTVFKCMFNRSRDWPDIEAMLDARTVDIADALAWISRLLGPDAGPFVRLSALAEQSGAATRPGTASADLPRVDWQSLGE